MVRETNSGAYATGPWGLFDSRGFQSTVSAWNELFVDLVDVAPEAVRFTPGAWCAWGGGNDRDVAFDDASETARDSVGHSGTLPSIADIDPDAVSVFGPGPASLALAMRWAQQALADGEVPPGVALACPVLVPAAYRRRRVNLKIDDPDMELPDSGLVVPFGPDLEAQLRALALAAETPVEDTEVFEAVQVMRRRCRYKAERAKTTGKKQTSYVALDSTGRIRASGPTPGAAIRAAAELAKSSLDGQDCYELEIVALGRRPDGTAIATVTRRRIAQKAGLRLHLATRKDTPDKLAGWLFFGVRGQVDTSDADETAAPETAASETAQGVLEDMVHDLRPDLDDAAVEAAAQSIIADDL